MVGAAGPALAVDAEPLGRLVTIHGGRIIWVGPVADMDRSGNAYVDQFIHGRAEGPIKMELWRA